MKLVWLFLRLGLFLFDQISLISYVREVVVDRLALMTEKDMNEVEALCKTSYGSTKLTLAFLVGNKIGNLFWGSGLVMVVLFPSLLVFGLLYGFGIRYLNDELIQVVGMGAIPVLAALLIVNGLNFASQARKELGNWRWSLVLVLALLLLVVLGIPIAVSLGVLFLLFVCFFKGGEAI